jgi:hypothetical protein
MHRVWQSRKVWVTCGVLLASMTAGIQPVSAQKFARSRQAARSDGDHKAQLSSPPAHPDERPIQQPTVDEVFDGAETAAPRPAARSPRSSDRGDAPRGPRTIRSRPAGAPAMLPRMSSPAGSGRSRVPSQFVPDWHSPMSGGTRGRGRVIRQRPGQAIDPQEGDIIIEEPNLSAGEIIGPGMNAGPAQGRPGTRGSRLGAAISGDAAMEDDVVIGGAPGDGAIMEDGTVLEGGMSDGTIVDEDGNIIEGGDGFGFGGCTDCGIVPFAGEVSPYYDLNSSARRAVRCDGICIPRRFVDEIALFVGPHAFKGPVDLGRNGNFGYQEGVNLSGQFGRWLGLAPLGLGYQVGATFLQSDFQGATVASPQGQSRNQQFFTAGVFRRAHAGYGVQGGVVYDYMHDTFYSKYSVAQLRAEISYLTLAGHEFGFWGAFNIYDGHGRVNGILTNYSTLDLYNAFYRYNFANGTQGRLWAGATGHNGGDFGADVRLPLSNQWDLWGWYNYVIPSAGAASGQGTAQQAWNLTMNIVWYPGRRGHGVHNTPFRSLFAPADNNWLIARPTGPQ